MNLTEGSGVRLALYATADELDVIRTVDLFFELAEMAARDAGRDSLHIRIVDLHTHFPFFAERLGLKANRDLWRLRDGRCPAVDLYDRAYEKSTTGEWAGSVHYLHEKIDLEKRKEGILRVMNSIRMPFEARWITYPGLLTRATETLKQMGSL